MKIRMLCSAAVLASASTALAAPNESSFTPDKLVVPLYGVTLNASGGGGATASIYHCTPTTSSAADGGIDAGTDMDGGVASDAGTASDAAMDLDAGALDGAAAPAAPRDCLVDMADPAALSALFQGAIDIPPGTYDSISFHHCIPGDDRYYSHVTGSVVLGSTTYYTTQQGGRVLSTDAADLGSVSLEHLGCASGVALPGDVTLVEDQEVTISAFFSLRNITWGALMTSSMGGCASSSVGGPQSVCTSYPIPVAYLGETTPHLSTYYITEDTSDLTATKAGGQLLVLTDEANHAFGGFSRRRYAETSVLPSANFDTPIKEVSPGSTPGSYRIQTFGGGGPSGPVDFYIRFPAFELMSHEGMFERPDGDPLPYRAVLQE